ncbi:hypothetical protein [uncultured Tenacibaculum sp.]|uniref:hypothetical protein n=1 Tax=uncultured Tenacibaculum sp. TaxID=174713 RepID=UPI00261B281C|nr:hypothetical protein [uncultured Tenacibaculum sp.]
MDKNKLIRENLQYHLNNSIQLFKGKFSFPNLLKKELKSIESIEWEGSSNIELEKFKKERQLKLIDLLNDKNLHDQLDYTIRQLVDVKDSFYQDYIENQLINNFSLIASNIFTENNLKLNVLFLEHDYQEEAYFCGFEAQDYKFKLLSGQEYLEFNHEKELFNGVGSFDYTMLLKPFLELEEAIDEDKLDVINDALVQGDYLEEVKKLFFLNSFLGIHLSLNKIKGKIRQTKIPMHDEVFVFANEHDCEQLNVFVL